MWWSDSTFNYNVSLTVAQTNLQHSLDFSRNVSLLVELDVLFRGPTRTLRCNLLHVGQHNTVSLRHRLELVKQKLQQFQQQPAERARERKIRGAES